jgi:hypothetical protein
MASSGERRLQMAQAVLREKKKTNKKKYKNVNEKRNMKSADYLKSIGL